MPSIEDINKFKKPKSTDSVKSYFADFEVKKVVTDAGVIREYPCIVFKTKHGNYMPQYHRLNPIKLNNFPEIKDKAIKYYEDLYDKQGKECYEDAPDGIKSILISYGFWCLDSIITQPRDYVMALFSEFESGYLISLIEYLESKGAFAVGKITNSRKNANNIVDMEAKISKLEAIVLKQEAMLNKQISEKEEG